MSIPLAGQKVKAADLAAIFPVNTDAWTSYTPTWTQSATITKTVARAAYMKIGRLVVVNGILVATSAGVANNPIIVTLPFAPVGSGPVGSSFLNDTGTAFYSGNVYITGTGSNVQFMNGGSSTAFWGQTGGGFTAAIASGDVLYWTATYEATS